MSTPEKWLSRGKVVPRMKSGFRKPVDNIAAIDFGTTFVSLAYKTAGDEKITTFKLTDVYTRVPNALLLRKTGEKLEVVKFGYRAQEEYSRIRSSDRQNYCYFERMKILLERGKEVNRSMTVYDFAGKEYYLVEVIAIILKHLKFQLVERLKMTAKALKSFDFDWIITVPAIWNAGGKQMMREAAYLAELLSDSVGIQHFTEVGENIPRPLAVNPDKLSLALEPEAAAIYCQHISTEDISDFCQSIVSPNSKKYVVLDIGGGTVDITSQCKQGVTGTLDVLTVPTGNSCGGTKVNEEFSKLLQNIVNDTNFVAFKNPPNPDDVCRNRAILNQLLYKEFEDEKVTFGDKATDKPNSPSHSDDVDEIKVVLPSSFISFYTEDAIIKGVKNLKDIRVEYDHDTLYLKFSKVKELFKPAIDGVLQCTSSAFSDLKSKVDMVYLVGGFGGCRYMYHIIKQHLGNDVNIIVPKEHKVAIAIGAVIWRENPNLITSRRADATYGISVSKPFKDGVHDPHYLFINDEGERRCNKVFEVYLEKGEIAYSHQVFTNTITPSRQNRSIMSFDLYCTANTGIQYIVDKDGCPTVHKIGHLDIDIPNPDNLPRRERKVELTWDFSTTEIQVRAFYTVTGAEVKCTADFLSAHLDAN